MGMRDWQNFFKTEDFDIASVNTELIDTHMLTTRDAVMLANAILREELKKAKRVYGGNFNGVWTWEEELILADTHTALLIDEKEIK